MPSDWMDDHVGSEGTPRAGFEGELARDLQREWRGGANPRWRIALWGVAASALLVGVIAVATRDGSRIVTPVDTTTPDSAVTASPLLKRALLFKRKVIDIRSEASVMSSASKPYIVATSSAEFTASDSNIRLVSPAAATPFMEKGLNLSKLLAAPGFAR